MRSRIFFQLALTAFIEGYSTLAVEVIAIRLAVPVVGSSATLTGVLLGVVLFALSAGYWRGGALSAQRDHDRTRVALSRNLWLAALMYTAIAFPAEAMLLERLLDWDFSLAWAIGVMGLVLFVPPVYLASQTVPMLAELLNWDGKAGKASGVILFFSTLGSVAGGVLTPTVFFPAIGVHASTYIVCLMLAAAGLVMAIGYMRPRWIAAGACLSLLGCWSAWPRHQDAQTRYSLDSAYQSIRVIEQKSDTGRIQRVLLANGGHASGIYADNGESSFTYILEADKALLETRSATVLVIGAAGFTFPRDAVRNDFVKRVDTVDVDPVLPEVAQEHFLFARLPSKIRFFPMSARDALRRFERKSEHYGLSFIDAYCGKGIPEELLTREFFSGVRSISGHTAVNVIMDRDVESAFARNVLATFRSAYGRVWLKDVKPRADTDTTNFLVTDWAREGATEWTGSGTVYTDDQNRADLDHVNLVWGSAGE
jgi:spermidine synthase